MEVFCLAATIYLMISSVLAVTDSSDAVVLHNLYRTLDFSPQLIGWKSTGGDPCNDAWKGISCRGSFVFSINLRGLQLSGYLSEELGMLNVKLLDLSSNRIRGRIPYMLPPYAIHVDLSCNDFSMNLPHFLIVMKDLRYLNLSHNLLSGPLENVFGEQHKLQKMDLSFNTFTGDLPSSFRSLMNLTELYLQDNSFGGSVAVLANLPLTHLNIKNNKFTGRLPEQFRYVKNLWIGGNAFGFPRSGHKITAPALSPNTVIEITILGTAVLLTAVIVAMRKLNRCSLQGLNDRDSRSFSIEDDTRCSLQGLNDRDSCPINIEDDTSIAPSQKKPAIQPNLESPTTQLERPK